MERYTWYAVAALAVAAGVYFRINGVATWPLADDEYFIFRAVELMFATGLPEFPCGGYYHRGLLFQVAALPLLAAGFSPELSVRAVAVAAGLLTLPAVFLLGRRTGGWRFALVVTSIIAVSAWEVEMSRFGRMYAPFQAVFAWYVYHAWCLVADADPRRWKWLFGLSIAGVLLWEGAVILLLCNFLPMFLRRDGWQIRHLMVAGGLFAASMAYTFTNFRYLGSEPFLANGANVAGGPATGLVDLAIAWAPSLQQAPWTWWLIAAAAAVLVAATAGVLRRGNADWWQAVVFVLVAILAAAGQFLLLLFVAAGALAVGWLTVSDLLRPGRRAYGLAVVATCVLVIGITLAGDSAASLTTRLRGLVGFPDLLYMIVYPWLEVIPLMSIVAGLSVGTAFLVLLLRPVSVGPGERLLLLIILASVFVVTAVPTLYRETRYSFFLYPVLICAAGIPLTYCIGVATARQGRALATGVPVLLLVAFGLSSDFDWRHLLRIDSYAANYRIGYSYALQRHYYIRNDYGSVAGFIERNAAPGDRIVVTTVPATPYLPQTDAIFMSYDDPRARGQICADGQAERWSGLPLIGSVDRLADNAAKHDGVTWVVEDQHLASNPDWEALRQQRIGKPVFSTQAGRLAVYRLE